ncbi:MAG TPA: mannonate dehydratase [Planctomycetota bacterium]|nr:mannonate dehydratase [Planctomycetota bacterium]
MKVGTQQASPTDDMLRYFAQFGVRNICGTPPPPGPRGSWEVSDLVKLRERVESFGIALDFLPLPMSARPLSLSESPHIMLGKSPERDREIEIVCDNIRAASKAGIPGLKYNLTMLGVVRTGRSPGRGGASYAGFDYSRSKKDELTEAGQVGADEVWARITYFLDRVVPVAEEHKVRIACHPNDPRLPDGFQGVSCVLGSVEGLKRFVEIRPSPYHGLNFCQGTVCEGLEHPAKEIFDVIRYFGSRKKIFNVHFRNIRGGYLNFQETYPDDGDVDMLQAMRVYKEVGYDGMLMPDHVPHTAGDERGLQSFAFAFGYIRGLIQAVDAEE